MSYGEIRILTSDKTYTQLLLLGLKRLLYFRYLTIYESDFPCFFSKTGYSEFVFLVQGRNKVNPLG